MSRNKWRWEKLHKADPEMPWGVTGHHSLVSGRDKRWGLLWSGRLEARNLHKSRDSKGPHPQSKGGQEKTLFAAQRDVKEGWDLCLDSGWKKTKVSPENSKPQAHCLYRSWTYNKNAQPREFNENLHGASESLLTRERRTQTVSAETDLQPGHEECPRKKEVSLKMSLK